MTIEPKNQISRGGRPDRQQGSALVVSLFLMVVAVGIVVSGSLTMKSSQSRTEMSFLVTGQATAFARSGLTEATNWFRRQTSRPVTTFAPILDTTADPQILDTEDPVIGLVREAKISGNLYGRYEVWKQWDDKDSPAY